MKKRNNYVYTYIRMEIQHIWYSNYLQIDYLETI